jgi:hypothetical protein
MTEYWDRFFCENHLLKTGLLLVYVGFIMAIHRIWSFNGYLRFDGHVTRNHCRKLNTCLNLLICWGFPTPFVVDRFYSVLIITFGMRPHEIKLNLCGFLFLVRWWVIGCSRWVIWFVHLILWLFFLLSSKTACFFAGSWHLNSANHGVPGFCCFTHVEACSDHEALCLPDAKSLASGILQRSQKRRFSDIQCFPS